MNAFNNAQIHTLTLYRSRSLPWKHIEQTEFSQSALLLRSSTVPYLSLPGVTGAGTNIEKKPLQFLHYCRCASVSKATFQSNVMRSLLSPAAATGYSYQLFHVWSKKWTFWCLRGESRYMVIIIIKLYKATASFTKNDAGFVHISLFPFFYVNGACRSYFEIVFW